MRVLATVAAIVVLLASGPRAGTLSLVQRPPGLVSSDTAISPDGKFVYAIQDPVFGTLSHGIAVASRDAATGRVTVVATVDVPFDQCCQGESAIALSPDGASLYVADHGQDSVTQFSRDAATGIPTFVARVGKDDPGVEGLDGVTDVQVSPDGKHLYVTSDEDDTVAVFARDASTGLLTFVEAHTNGVGPIAGMDRPQWLTSSADGRFVYVAGPNATDGGIVVFARDATTGTLTFVERENDGPAGPGSTMSADALALSPDGAQLYALVYTGVQEGVAEFARDADAGTLAFVAFHPTLGFLNEPFRKSIGLDPAGTQLWMHTFNGFALEVFTRAADGTLTHVDTQRFPDHDAAFPANDGWVASPDGRFAYLGTEVFQVVGVVCPDAPVAGCRASTAPAKSVLSLRNDTADDHDRLGWRWARGADTPPGALGDPTSTTDYALCIWDAGAGPQPRAHSIAPAGNRCGGTPCWTLTSMQATYRDGELLPEGMFSLVVKAGTTGAATATAKARGKFLRAPNIPLTPPVVAQLITSDGECWGATYSTPVRNDGRHFRARSD